MTADQHQNTGAMALGALPDDEAGEFLAHLEDCPVCSAELAGFLETTATLGSSVAQTPPASLRRSVMEAVARTPQLPPLAPPEASSGQRFTTETDSAPDSATGDRNLATVTALRRPWYRRPQTWIAAAVAVLIVGGGTTAIVANRSSAPASADACVAAAPDRSLLGPTVGSGGDVMLAPSCDVAVVKVPALAAAPAGKVYQLWVIKDSGAVSAGVMKSNSDGSFPAVSMRVHAGDSAVGVTLEPSPGSVKPTAKPFWVVPLAA